MEARRALASTTARLAPQWHDAGALASRTSCSLYKWYPANTSLARSGTHRLQTRPCGLLLLAMLCSRGPAATGQVLALKAPAAVV